jgi:hypothetical protein
MDMNSYYFYLNQNKMSKLSSVVFFLAFFVLLATSCKREDSFITASNNNIQLTTAQVVPAVAPSTASGTMKASYDAETHLLSYSFTWTGLSGNPTSMHIHGLADPGFVATPAPLGSYSNGIIQNITGFTAATTGSREGSLFIDGKVIREADLLAGKYYIDIHTAARPAGELRGQIVLNQ